MSKFQRIEPPILAQHHHLRADDECYFLREYTPGAGPKASSTNHLVWNLKKGVGRVHLLKYRRDAIAQCGRELGEAMRLPTSADKLSRWTVVPIPPSKTKDDPDYDDRLLRVLRELPGWRSLDIRELIALDHSLEPARDQLVRPTPEQYRRYFRIAEELCHPEPEKILLFDDILATGAHFRGAVDILEGRFPDVRFAGIFIARNVRPEAEDLIDQLQL